MTGTSCLKRKKILKKFIYTGVKSPWTDRNDILHVGRGLGVADLIARAKLGDDRFIYLCVVGVEFQVFPSTCVVVLTTLQHYRDDFVAHFWLWYMFNL